MSSMNNTTATRSGSGCQTLDALGTENLTKLVVNKLGISRIGGILPPRKETRKRRQDATDTANDSTLNITQTRN